MGNLGATSVLVGRQLLQLKKNNNKRLFKAQRHGKDHLGQLPGGKGKVEFFRVTGMFANLEEMWRKVTYLTRLSD